MNPVKRYGMPLKDSLIEASDLGIVNGHITLNGWKEDLCQIRGLFAPPYFCRNFRLELRFGGKRIQAENGFWQGNGLQRSGKQNGIRYRSLLILAAGDRGAVLEVTLKNTAPLPAEIPVQYELYGGLKKTGHWEFNFPKGEERGEPAADEKGVQIDTEAGRIRLCSTLRLKAGAKEIFDGEPLRIPAGKSAVFYTVLTAGAPQEADALAQKLISAPEKAVLAARKEWKDRIRKLENAMPRFSAGLPALEKLYDRSLLHLLLNEWNVPEWLLHPYYATGGINGGCCCSYLWNYGEPYRLWSMLDPEAAKKQLKVYLKQDLSGGYAFYPDDGKLFGPYYPVNQEKVLFLADAYVLQTGDKAFLNEKCGKKSVLQILCEQALMHDDLTKKAVLVNYGDGNHHLELRGKLRYDGTVPDLNLRRCVNYRLADRLCRLAGKKPPADFIRRAEDLKNLIEKRLFDGKAGWFRAFGMDGKPYLRYTIQMFKTLGWGNWCLTEKTEKALLAHLNEKEFLGKYGMHSLSEKDPAYDPADVDNGGPGACISFTPAVADRLFQSGRPEAGWNIFRRLLWLGDTLPYWGDSHMADRMEYRRDTPLQNDIQGAALAQTVIFGLFGIRVMEDSSLRIRPYLPPETRHMALEKIRLAGRDFSVRVTEKNFSVECDGKEYRKKRGETFILPAKHSADSSLQDGTDTNLAAEKKTV